MLVSIPAELTTLRLVGAKVKKWTDSNGVTHYSDRLAKLGGVSCCGKWIDETSVPERVKCFNCRQALVMNGKGWPK